MQNSIKNIKRYLITQNHTLEMMYTNAVSEYKHKLDWNQKFKKS